MSYNILKPKIVFVEVIIVIIDIVFVDTVTSCLTAPFGRRSRHSLIIRVEHTLVMLERAGRRVAMLNAPDSSLSCRPCRTHRRHDDRPGSSLVV